MVAPTVPKESPCGQAALPYPAVIYARVSTKDQADNGYSLDDQVKQCLACAQKQGDDIPEAAFSRKTTRG